MKKQNKKPSEGEKFIADYLRSEKIKFEREVYIYDLKHDSKSSRRADFYLKDLKVYIEFNGMWNNTKEDRARYREKKKVYKENKIPCIYLYPENLGIIDYCFSQRLVEEMKKHQLTKELFKYRLKRLIDNKGSVFVFIFIFSLLIFNSKYETPKDKQFVYFLIFGVIYQLYRLYKGYILFFKNDTYFNEFK